MPRFFAPVRTAIVAAGAFLALSASPGAAESGACPEAIEVSPPSVSPAAPPAYTTYVVSWDTLGAGEPGPGGGAQSLRFRLRRTSSSEVKESLIDSGTAAFADGPGEYVYQVRTENACGEAGDWSKATLVVVGTTKTSALVLVSAPKPILVPGAGTEAPRDLLAVRNAGSETLDVDGDQRRRRSRVVARPRSASSRASSATVSVTRDPGPRPRRAAPHRGHLRREGSLPARPDRRRRRRGHGRRGRPDGTTKAADIDRVGERPAGATLVNPGSLPAAIVDLDLGGVAHVSAMDGKTWDRPLAPGEDEARLDRRSTGASAGPRSGPRSRP